MHLSTWYQRENYSKTIQATSAGAVLEFNSVYCKFGTQKESQNLYVLSCSADLEKKNFKGLENFRHFWK